MHFNLIFESFNKSAKQCGFRNIQKRYIQNTVNNWEMRSVSLDYGNITNWKDYSGIAFLTANSAVLLFTSCVGIAANLFVILAVYHQKSLRTWNNALLVNLAVIDIFRCAIDCPILLAIILNNQQGYVDGLLCDAQVVSFSFSFCIQLLTLAGISAERYQAIARPFQTKERRTRVLIMIPLTWSIAILVAVFCLTSMKDSPVYVQCRGLGVENLPSYDTFGQYILLPLWSVCFAVIIGFYSRIFAIVRAHGRKIFDKGTVLKQGKSKEKKEEDDSKVNKKSQEEVHDKNVQTNEKTVNLEQTVGLEKTVSLEQTVSKEQTVGQEQQVMPGEIKASHTDAPADPINSPCKNTKSPKRAGVTFREGALTVIDLDEGLTAPSERLEVSELEQQPVVSFEAQDVVALPGRETEAIQSVTISAPDQNEDVDGAVCMMPSMASKERANKKKEGKMAKRSGYIILTFLIFWIPLIVMILVNFFINREKNAGVSLIVVQHAMYAFRNVLRKK